MQSATIIFLCSILGLVHSITVTIPERTVNSTEGGTGFLTCTFTTSSPTTKLVVEWSFIPNHGSGQSEQVLYYQGGETAVGKKFEGKVKLLSNPAMTKNASISIANLQQDNTGMYICQVNNFPDVDGKNEKTVFLNVLVKPSTPFCATHGEAITGHQIILTCHSKDGNPPPTYTWKNLDDGYVKGTQDAKRGTLVIQNISEVQFGQYECVASNGVGSSTCMVDLSEEINDGIIAGAVIGALLICGVIVLVVIFVARHIKTHHRMKVTKNKKDSEMQPMRGNKAAQQVIEDGEEHPAV